MSEDARAAGFQSPEDTTIATREVGGAAAVAREEAEIKGGIFLAQQLPRDEARAYTGIINACRRPGFAEVARYVFPRGGSQVKGPSVQLAREIARSWGNIRYGLRVVALDSETVHIRGYAHDLQANAYVEHEDKFARLIQRKFGRETKWVPPDERDLRELINRRGAILVRNAILQVVPSDVVEAAVREAEETIRKAADGEIQQNRTDAIRRLAVAFSGLGVSTEMLTEYLGHPLDALTADELSELRGVYKSISDGNTKVSEHFDLNAGRNAPTASNEELNAALQSEEKSADKAETPKQDGKAEQKPRGGKGNGDGQSSLI